MPRTILFLVPYPLDEAPSQRFRFEQYFGILKEHEFKIHVQSFLNTSNWKVFYQQGKQLQKAAALLSGITLRFFTLFTLPKYDFIFIHREVMPLGPPVMEWIIAKIFRKQIIYDFDDAIWQTDNANENAFLRWLKCRSKVGKICRWSYKISCGNQYLCDYAVTYNPAVVLVPTTVDTETRHNRALLHYEKSRDVTIGWTGSSSTLKYLEQLEPVLIKLQEKYTAAKFIVIADKKPSLCLKNMEFVPWQKESEVANLTRIQIGIMPLPDDQWAKGKCGFKAIQYMAMEIPPVISPVGMNRQLVHHGVNGFLADSDQEWLQFVGVLIENEMLRETMGKIARQKIVASYSVSSNSSLFLALFA